MRIATIDLGTNSTRALVADVADGGLVELERLLTITRLGEGVDATRRLQPEPMRRVGACVTSYCARARELGAERIVAVATSAVRDSANGREFLANLEAAHVIETCLLTGEEEARLTYRGVTAGRQVTAGGRAAARDRVTIVDVGGGSTELVVGLGTDVSFSASLDVGCVRLTERFLHGDPPTATELDAAAVHVRALLAHRAAPAAGSGRLIGVAGTVTTLATLHLGLPSESAAIDGHVLPRGWIDEECDRLAALTIAGRRALTGLHPDRAPVIVAGAICVRETVAHAGATGLEVSLRDVLHGAALAAAAGQL